MASQSLISAVNSYDNYIQRKGIDEQVIDAYIEACRVAINGEKDITYSIFDFKTWWCGIRQSSHKHSFTGKEFEAVIYNSFNRSKCQ